MDDREIVATIRARLADRVGQERYEVWFGPLTQLTLRDETLVIHVPNQFFQDWLRSHFRKDLEVVSQEVYGQPVGLEFRIAAPVPTERRPAERRPAERPATAGEPKPQDATCPADGSAAALTKAASGDHSPGQSCRRRPWASLDGFVVGNSNCLAHKTAQITAEQPGTYSPLLIHGPTGTGKTHLLEGICCAFRRLRPRAAAVLVSAEQFTSCFVEALHGSGLPNFRRKHRELELLAIDDVQFFANKRATLVELLHTVESLLRAGRQLVFAADRPPAALKMLGPELMARLSGGMGCRLEPPEYATRLGIVRQVATGLGLAIPQDVGAFIAAHFTTQARELVGALKRLQATSQAHQAPITLALAEEALADLIDHQGRPVKLADIEQAVCDVFGLDPRSLQAGGKAKAVSHPRMLAMFLARKHTRAALSEIGSYFGRRSHSTVISAQKKVAGWMANGSAVQLQHRTLSLEETIRRVEERLRAG